MATIPSGQVNKYTVRVNKRTITEAYGWYGTIAIVLAYALVSFKLISANGYMYQILNLTGALGIVIVSLTKKAQQPAALNIVWAIIATVAIVGLLIKG